MPKQAPSQAGGRTRTPVPVAARSREETKQDTRRKLIRAASDLFREQGLDAPSLDAICERAGFTRGAFYVHFKDRDDLMVAVFERSNQKRLESIIAKSDEALDLELTIRMFTRAVESGAYPDLGAVRLHQTLSAFARSEALREKQGALVRESMRRVADAARRGQRAGTVRRDIDAERVGELLLVVVSGVEMLIEMGVPFDIAKGAEALLAMLRPNQPDQRKGAAP